MNYERLERLDKSMILMLWDYSPSLSRLLLRINMGSIPPDSFRIIDIIFFGVKYINIPNRIKGMFVQPNFAEIQKYARYDLKINKIFCIEGVDQDRYHIVGVDYVILEHIGDLFDSPILTAS